MKRSRSRSVLVLAALAVSRSALAHAPPEIAASPPPVPGSVASVLTSVLDASGVRDGSDRVRIVRTFAGVVGELRPLEEIRSPYRRARRMHELLHEKTFRHYDAGADTIQAVLDRGEYNCVSAVLVEGMVARALGMDPSVVESPRHLSLRLSLDGRLVYVDSASPAGFDASRERARFREFLLAYKLATAQEIEARGLDALWDEFKGLQRPVTLEEGVAFLWRNAGERALERGDAAAGAEAYREAWILRPDAGPQFDQMLAALARAFRIEYDAARFDTAFRIAAIENEMLPGRASVQDRLLAAAMHRIEAAADAGDAGLAESLLDEAAAPFPDGTRRLEAEACPRIAAAAVRAGNWELARRMARRYAAAGTDPVEAAGLAAWVERRSPAAPRVPPLD